MLKTVMKISFWVAVVFLGMNAITLFYIDAQGLNIDKEGARINLWTLDIWMTIFSGYILALIIVLAVFFAGSGIKHLITARKTNETPAATPGE